MLRKRAVVCCDCGVEFETMSDSKIRCEKCQRKHHLENNRRLYQKRKAELASMPDSKREESLAWGEKPLRASTMLNLPCPWADGRLPESVRLNQLWG